MVLQVFLRHFTGYSLYWAEEMVRFLFIWTMYFSAACAFKKGELAVMNFFYEKITIVKIKKSFFIVQSIIILILLIFLFYGGSYIAFYNIRQLSAALRISMFFPYLAVPIGSLIMILFHIVNSVKYFLVDGL